MDSLAQPHSHHVHDKHHSGAHARSWRDYIPLIALVAVSILAALAIYRSYGPGMNPIRAMHAFMGIFLTIFALLKLFDLSGFADGFQMYDLLAKPIRPYAYLYPFIELGLGLGYLTFQQPSIVYWATIVVMVFGSLGVFNALRKGLDLECACMGTVLKVPLSTVALVEDLSMAAMAALMLYFV